MCIHLYKNEKLGNLAFSIKSKDIMLNFYKTLVRPLLEYCSKPIPELKDLSYEEGIDRLGLWTLEERRNRADLIEVYKMHRGVVRNVFYA